MSSLFYNGISLEVVRTVHYARRVMLDGPSYLFTTHRLHVACLYHPGATSYTFNGGDQDNIAAEAGNNPAETDRIIRHRLMQPRKKLIYTQAGARNFDGTPNVNVDGYGDVSGSLVILDCPPSINPNTPNFSTNPALDQYLTDANNGPTPIRCDVHRITGTKSFHVEYVIEASVNECFNYYSNPTPLLSERWAVTHDVDRDGFTTRRVSGHAVFRTDQLLKMKANPDDFRRQLFHPIPRGMQRTQVRVRAHEDGNRIDFAYTDVEMSHDILVAGVTRLEAYAVVEAVDRSFEERLMAGAGLLVGGGSRLFDFVGALRAAMPSQTLSLVVRAWGNRRSKRSSLSAVCHRVLATKLPAVIGNDKYGIRFRQVLDLMGRFVEVRALFTAGPFSSGFEALGGELEKRFPELFEDGMGDIASDTPQVGKAAVEEEGKGAWGTYFEAAVASALQAPCKNPGTPFNVGVVERPIPTPS